MDLVKLERTIPIKSIPESELNAIIINEFTVWIASLLSLTDEVSADRLTVALPAIKEHCWSMGFKEIKKMFEMYVDGKLSVKPLPNYFDRIMLGKIVAAYNQQKPKPTLKEMQGSKPMSEEEIDAFMQPLIEEARLKYQKDGIIETPTSKYDYLAKKGIIQKALGKEGKEFDDYKIQKYKLLQEILLNDWKEKKATTSQEKNDIKNTVKDLQTGKSGKVIVATKEFILTEYFNTIKTK